MRDPRLLARLVPRKWNVDACLKHSNAAAVEKNKKNSTPACVDVYVPASHAFNPAVLPGFVGLAEQHGLKSYKDFHRFSLENSDQFWGALGSAYLDWQKDFTTVQESNFKTGDIKWFLGGKLNVSYNCLDRHVARTPDKTALIWEKDEPGKEERITYSQLLGMTCRLANVLKQANVKHGDRVVIYLPNCPLAVAGMMACARIGAIHSLVFAGFSADALRDRIQNCEAKVVITVDEMTRGGKVIGLKKIVDAAVKDCPSVQAVFLEQRSKNEGKATKLDVRLHDALSGVDAICKPEVMDSEDPLFLLYTSGSTGKPKGLIHTQAGYLLYAAVTQQVAFNYSPAEDVFGCVADVGWITGHSYIVYGPLANGGTTVLFESTPLYPNPSRYWEMVERLKINQLYLSPTAVRSLLKRGDEHLRDHDLSSLKTLGVVGEPINHEAWEWLYDKVGNRKCPIVDTYWQTETGGVIIAPLPADAGDPIYPSMAMRPFFGIDPIIENSEALVDHGADLAGAIYIKQAWPGITRGVYGDQQRFVETYFSQSPGHYCTGDGAIETPEGYFRVTGRTDEVINISGHRLGTAEIEDALDLHDGLSESAVISFPHSVKGEGLVAFVVMKDSHAKDDRKKIVKELKDVIKMKIASYAVPEEILICQSLPKTRSGKIMRRILKQIATSKTDDFGDTSTLADPYVLEAIIATWSETHTHAENTKT
ncbi:Acetyl-coenzyme A synthetase 2-like, mitochondrial [Hypsibius exemplaris]|uniref:Acetyl-coenzyme A synthetase n=1 Tax=Hypsibius exemplaris TaxID=2072580 RepID=A0A1W0WWM8_HYPEX|nr:Acetyl-coenzyme A synthetase 2-like, mitochondrial [Hypsibius exemplaris]